MCHCANRNQLYLICADGTSRTTRFRVRLFGERFDLVQIDTLEENDFLLHKPPVTAGDFKRFWIGLMKDAQ